MSVGSLHNLLDPAILFFFLGVIIALLRSNLEIPPGVVRFFSLYLLMAMGFKGGVSLSTAEISGSLWATLLAAVILAVSIPAMAYFYLSRRFKPFDAAAVAAAYGSVSAVTFITATQVLEREGIVFSGHMMVAMVLMESPAIIMAVLLAHYARARMGKQATQGHVSLPALIREALTDGAQLLLIGSLAIGAVVGLEGKKIMDPFTGQIFKGILAFFLLDMGLSVVRKGRELDPGFRALLGFGVVMPLVGAALALLLAVVFGLSSGDTVLLMVLGASASYIVVPAVIREAIPEANPGLYFGSALVITFPFNILVGIPLYLLVMKNVFSALG